MKRIFIWVVVIVLIGVGIVVGKNIGKPAADYVLGRSSTSTNKPDLEAVLAATINLINQDLPKMMDNNTRLDRTLLEPGKKFTYLVTLVNSARSDINITALDNAFRTHFRKHVCTNVKMQSYLKGGVTIIYRYQDKNGEVIADIAGNWNDCL